MKSEQQLCNVVDWWCGGQHIQFLQVLFEIESLLIHLDLDCIFQLGLSVETDFESLSVHL
jgi:hypothetical protein